MKDGTRLPAIIHARYGAGNAILSGVHFEFEASEIQGKKRDDANNLARSNLIDAILSKKLGLSVGSVKEFDELNLN
jgi:glutamine amidotransferase-like uncharacterized protein